MKTAAVVCEYNPFHNGHKYQLEETRRAGATHIVAVMSGNFVQRGEAAVFDKFLRANAAISCGADLVVELPLPWAMSSAQTFARGAVGLTAAIGNVDMLSFGCECGDADKLRAVAAALYSAEFEDRINSLLSESPSYAAARQRAVGDMLGAEYAAILAEPNNILAIEYIASATVFGSDFELNAVGRIGDGYNDTIHSGSGFASATAIRSLIRNGEDYSSLVPDEVRELYLCDFSDESRLETAILCSLRRLSVSDIASAPDISEGLENRIYDAVRSSATVAELMDKIKTKRYPTARLRRIVMSLFLGLRAEYSTGIPPYIRILACGE
ncbi:MAG: nucleotidyltransferase family protein, partial [Clostridia bacterium]|nr:nucleotidyltransferase family protein [Clostridia bacterium]